MKALSKEELTAMIMKHTKRAEFNKEFGTGKMRAIKRNDLYDLYCKQMPMQLAGVGHWTNDKVIALAKDFKGNRSDFRKDNEGAYSAMARRKELHLLDNILPSRNHWSKSKVIAIASKYTMAKPFIEENAGAYNHATKNGYYAEIKAKFVDGNTSWSYNDLKDEALKYNTMGDFRTGSSAYDTILARGLLSELCSHLDYSHAGGFNPTKAGTLYYLRINNGQAYKIGITNRSVSERFNSCDLDKIEVLKTWDYPIGHDARDMETKIINDYSYAKYSGDDLLESGNTELFDRDILGLDVR